MGLHRLTAITLGVPDPTATAEFFTSFGLRELGDGRFATRDGGEQLRLEASPRRSLHRLGVGVHDRDDLDRIAHRLTSDFPEIRHELRADALDVVEPVTGLMVELTVAPVLQVDDVPVAAVNSPSTVERVDVPAAAVLGGNPVQPSNLTHLVYGSPDQPTTLRFFTEAIGFEVSDAIDGIIAFTRCGEVHHNLAIQAAPCAFVHHVAFEVDGVDDVARGGTAMIEGDPERHLWGIGRHAIGSNWFWYLREPSGTYVEYTADVDRISAQDLYRPKDWSGHEFLYALGQPPPPDFLEPPDLATLVELSA
jgi:catechol 2,3-dioxygenase-like lactoylglutathione lyase family enzyme